MVLSRGIERAILTAGQRRRTAVPVVSFLPSDIAGLTLWLKPESFPVLADGASITTWTDASGAGNTPTATVKPVYKTAIRNGYAVARFDGNTQFMLTPSLAARTIFAVMSLSNNSLVDCLLAQSAVDALNIRRDNTPNTTSRWRGQSGDGGTDGNDFANSGTFKVNGVRTPIVAENVWHQIYATRPAAATNAWTIGGNTNTNRYLQVDLAEFIVYSTALTAPQEASVEAYLATKFGL